MSLISSQRWFRMALIGLFSPFLCIMPRAAQAPHIITQPANQEVCVGSPVTFSVKASGSKPISYQWRFNNNAIDGATSDVLSFSPAVQDAGTYSVVVSNSAGSETSTDAILIVDSTTATPLVDVVACAGTSATFSTIASGLGPFSYVWRKDGQLLAETTSSLTLSSVSDADDGVYSVEVKGACNTVTTSATLFVLTPPPVTVLLDIDSSYDGAIVQLTAVVNGAVGVGFLWEVDGIPIAVSGPTLILDMAIFQEGALQGGSHLVTVAVAVDNGLPCKQVTVTANNEFTTLPPILLSRSQPVVHSSIGDAGSGPTIQSLCGALTGNSKWFRLAVQDPGWAAVTASGTGANCILAVFRGSILSLSDVQCSTTTDSIQAGVQFNAQSGIAYWIAVDGTLDPTAGVNVSYVDPQVLNRLVFYNNSSFDGNDASANSNDDRAIATDKTALLPGQTASFANYTSFSKGLNGIMIDVVGFAGTPALADFTFKAGNNATPGTWADAPSPNLTVRPAAGVEGSDRVTLTWLDNQIQKQWLQVTFKATPNTGLAADDVFYFGNAIGESGNSSTDAQVNLSDENAARQHPANFLNPAAVDNPYDYNRDQRVDISDENLARQNNTSFLTALKLISVPAL